MADAILLGTVQKTLLGGWGGGCFSIFAFKDTE